MSDASLNKADDFIQNESQFHLGFLPTEQSNPLTVHMGDEFQSDPVQGVKTLQRADREVLRMAKRVFTSPEYETFVRDGLETVRHGGRIIFSGCGATGRLSILLESLWRNACARTAGMGKYSSSAESIMTGGDFALVRSVEFFEDYAEFGRRQAADARIGSNDMLVAISEGGETSSVIGTIQESAERGAKVFFLFNNPAEILCEHLERSRNVIRDPRVKVLDLYCCPMALAGSTRMQATTSEQLIAGAMLETVFLTLTGTQEVPDYAKEFERVLSALETDGARKAIADYLVLETECYRRHGYVTYFANDCLLDIFTDTTERSPTFMLPPFRKMDDTASPRPWAFVKNPLFDTKQTWDYAMRRPLRCLEWTIADYASMGASSKIRANPPAISSADLLRIPVGNEIPRDRSVTPEDLAVLLKTVSDPALESAFDALKRIFPHMKRISIGGGSDADYVVPVPEFPGAFPLMRNMAVKLFFNTVSTGVMARFGRVAGNWMSFVDCTNKKLLDRGVRLLVELTGTDYRTGCAALFDAMEKIEAGEYPGTEKPSPVQIALAALKK